MAGISSHPSSLSAGLPPRPRAIWLLPLGVLCVVYGLLGLTLTDPLTHSEIMQRCVLVDPSRSRLWSVGNIEVGLAYLGVFAGMLFYFLRAYSQNRQHLRDFGLALAYLVGSFALDYACVQTLHPFAALLIGDAVVITFTALVSRQLWFQRLLGVFVPLVFLTCGIGHFLEGLSYWHLTYPVNVPWTMVTADIGFAILLNGSRFPAFIRGEDMVEELAAERTRAEALQEQIAARLTADEARQESEGLYRTLFETMGQGVVYHDAKGNITDANPAAERLLGLSLDQMRERKTADPRWRTLREDGTDLPAEQNPNIVALRTGRPVRDMVVGVFHPVTEETRWLQVSATPEFRPGEIRPFRVYAMFEDITERRAAHLALEGSERLRRAALAGAPLILWATDGHGLVTLAEGSGLALLGYASGETVGRSALEMGQDDVAVQSLRRALAGEAASYDAHVGGLHFHSELRPQRDESGAVTGVIGVALDVTERHQAEEALRLSHQSLVESEQRLRLALESGRLGSWELDLTTGEYHNVSIILKALYGLSPDAKFTIADRLRSVHPEDLARVQGAVREAGRTGHITIAEFRILWPDGSEHWLRACGQAVYSGRNVRLIGVTQDITEQKGAEAALKEAAERQKTLMRDVLSSVTGGRLRLVETEVDLPKPLSEANAPIPLTPTEGLWALRHSVKDAAIRMGFSDERWHGVMTAASEGGMNAIVHGGGKGEGCVSTDRRPVVQVRVKDWGAGINTESLPKATLARGWSSTTSLGHGLVMILESVDRLWLLTGPGGTTVVMEQDREEPPPAWL